MLTFVIRPAAFLATKPLAVFVLWIPRRRCRLPGGERRQAIVAIGDQDLPREGHPDERAFGSDVDVGLARVVPLADRRAGTRSVDELAGDVGVPVAVEGRADGEVAERSGRVELRHERHRSPARDPDAAPQQYSKAPIDSSFLDDLSTITPHTVDWKCPARYESETAQ